MQTKEQAKKVKSTKQPYAFINVRVTPETKAAMNKLAKSRKLSLSKAVEYLIEGEVFAAQHKPEVAGHVPLHVDPTVTLTSEEIEAYEKPQLMSAGKPVTITARGPWFVRLLNRFFGR